MKKIISIVGARPNFMKIAPIHKVLCQFSDQVQHLICHTGQHYDKNMSGVFFSEFDLAEPDIFLGVGGGSHAEQTARIMIEFEKVCLLEKPDLVIVVGDVNSTLACSIVAKKMWIPIAHIEAGLRSFDLTMPEEINRIVTDSITDYFFVTEQSGITNLLREGKPIENIFFTGNVMIDTLVNLTPKIKSSKVLENLQLVERSYILITFHRPSNVDDKDDLFKFVDFINRIAELRTIVFPVHPRTRKNLNEISSVKRISDNVILIDPLGYQDFQALVRNAELIITDSGGIQEESTFLGIQCVTVRDNTERPVTIDIGTNHLVGKDLKMAYQVSNEILSGKLKMGKIPDLWDGNAAKRIVKILMKIINEK